jgi:hydroxymethylbilane synthase
MQQSLTIGTRGSPLALYQANLVQRLLAEKSGLGLEAFPIKILKTSGDRLKGHLSAFGGKGLFTKELEEALIQGEIDLAVHSMKDVPTVGQESLEITAILPREDPRDAFISNTYGKLEDLPQGALVGTASIRRRAQLSAMRPDIEYCLLRGNVGTRLQKLADGVCDATFLACAGLKRLEQEDVITEAISTEDMLPAPAQGAIGIEIRKSDEKAKALIAPLNCKASEMAITAERAFLRALDGSCRTPIAALAVWDGSTMVFRGEVVAKDGSLRFGAEDTVALTTLIEAYDLGYRLGQNVRAAAGENIIWDE